MNLVIKIIKILSVELFRSHYKIKKIRRYCCPLIYLLHSIVHICGQSRFEIKKKNVLRLSGKVWQLVGPLNATIVASILPSLSRFTFSLSSETLTSSSRLHTYNRWMTHLEYESLKKKKRYKFQFVKIRFIFLWQSFGSKAEWHIAFRI